MPQLHTAADIGSRYRVVDRTVRSWVARGLLPPPRKLGPHIQSPARWTDEDLAVLDANLAALAATPRNAA